ncbi:12291_t:CDS:1, partial [Cetraspora pellucida]
WPVEPTEIYETKVESANLVMANLMFKAIASYPHKYRGRGGAQGAPPLHTKHSNLELPTIATRCRVSYEAGWAS